MKPHVIVILVGAIAVVFVLGILAGIWFNRHYRIVPVETAAERTAGAFQTVAPHYSPPASPSASPFGTKAPAPPVAAPAPSTGLFSYQFVPGETMHYGINADIQGTGIDLGQGSNIGMNFGSKLALYTENVDPTGAGNLRLDFQNVDMTGDFMGSPVELHQSPDRTVLNMNARTKIDSSQGISLGVIPQLDFFKQPIHMNVARNGDILKVAGAEGFDQMLAPMTKLMPDNIEASGLHEGSQWISQFLMPIPGLGQGVKTVTRNTFTGYELVGNRQCAVVRQEMTSNQTDGTMSTPASILGEALSFAIPQFSVTGTNIIYFDSANGKLVRADMDLDFNLKIGAQLKPLTDLMKMYGDALGDALGGNAGKIAKPPSANSEDIGVKIKGTLSLEE